MLQLTPTGLHIGQLPAETASIDVSFDGRRIWSIDVRDRDEPGDQDEAADHSDDDAPREVPLTGGFHAVAPRPHPRQR